MGAGGVTQRRAAVRATHRAREIRQGARMSGSMTGMAHVSRDTRSRRFTCVDARTIASDKRMRRAL